MCLTSRDPPSDELWQMLCAHVGPTPNVVFVLNSVAVSKHCGCSNLFFGVAGGCQGAGLRAAGRSLGHMGPIARGDLETGTATTRLPDIPLPISETAQQRYRRRSEY